MLFFELDLLIEKYNIPKDVKLLSDSGWECDATNMDGVYYNQKENVIVFVQDRDRDYEKDGWVLLIR